MWNNVTYVGILPFAAVFTWCLLDWFLKEASKNWPLLIFHISILFSESTKRPFLLSQPFVTRFRKSPSNFTLNRILFVQLEVEIKLKKRIVFSVQMWHRTLKWRGLYEWKNDLFRLLSEYRCAVRISLHFIVLLMSNISFVHKTKKVLLHNYQYFILISPYLSMEIILSTTRP